MTEFDPKWPHGHTTRDGKEARIYALDGSGSYPIHGAIKVGEKWEAWNWQINGSWLEDGRAVAADLINAPEKAERWVNLYLETSNTSALHKSLGIAELGGQYGSGEVSPKLSGRVKITFIDGKPVSAEIVEA
jgi:hypothetical protein